MLNSNQDLSNFITLTPQNTSGQDLVWNPSKSYFIPLHRYILNTTYSTAAHSKGLKQSKVFKYDLVIENFIKFSLSSQT